ncbi:hypothetical protein M431DRAFT_192435 [Trichoderma harzianum CBS 226.95]|uniref:Uncharacterized protein n=1 Tax=Trichoderma harzianum CBS 226.95 TaxID=983964 RepID=A0A2T4AUB1_TRIHA|nr:hypothetical protein M431DRAFT_192435 [Trichoderma harzianum CBS 226.95]PTB60653.1 hypothetical protein M431DRAFT_192435 [Trichoderma harzianum CBS 226.95]
MPADASDMELNDPVACGAKTPGPATPSRSRSGAAPCPCSLSCASLRLSLTEIFNAIVSFPMTKCAITRRPFEIWGNCIILSLGATRSVDFISPPLDGWLL